MSLRIEHITKKFDAATVLSDIDLEIRDGEFISILGPSGCGKTTLLRIIAGFLTPTSGEIKFNDRLYASNNYSVPVEKRNLGMVFQSFALWPHMTVKEHLAFPLQSQKVQQSKDVENRIIDKILAVTGLEKLANSLPGELSGGQQQRVALARAMINKPKLLLMDEPLSALDADLKLSMRQEIQNIHKITGATILYVTHDQSEALAMSNRIVVMKDGTVEQFGTPEEIYGKPQTLFVAAFVGRHNMISGKWDGKQFICKNGTAFPAVPPAECFIEKGICPLRPEELEVNRDNIGICVEIVSKQYNGREFLYTAVDADKKTYHFYAIVTMLFSAGQKIHLTKKSV
ncbi:iron(III) transport system ATP-binding protein [Propionispira arboris]|uniref:ABC-type quaternary amine transporter n=1 Tax=Propionispira arboris TaxID=84035 RepID=A0A1H6V0Z9_9FIRM|nr:ABC transporter ATP-binding protein [Propionispira arboris]SEI98249.1 iron(III) transport system ATP-binding protein [Propionispira arboris]